MEPTGFRPAELRHSMSLLSATIPSGSSRVNQPSSVSTSSILPVIQPQGIMDHRARRTSGNSTINIYTPSNRFSIPPWQEVSSGSPSTPMANQKTTPIQPRNNPQPAPLNISPSAPKGAVRASPPVSPQQTQEQDGWHGVYTTPNEDSTPHVSTTTLAPSVVGLLMYSAHTR